MMVIVNGYPGTPIISPDQLSATLKNGDQHTTTHVTILCGGI